ncbi:MAG TPA: Vms1/Ankzf1 family peptidyl-tRNA hydrolase [Actinomycetales bacterium]|nr:Vms1/Ankzf1 family peptidyl-tRNA hydrolase [Actinomycetales bacterium]
MRLDWLNPLVGRSGPFATVAVDTTREAPESAHEIELRWAGHARRLTSLGASKATIDALEDAAVAPTGRAGRTGRLLVAADDALVLDLVLPQPPAREITTLGPVPQLMPAVRAFATCAPHLLVQVNRTGADIDVVGILGQQSAHEQVDGDHDVLHKVPGGGWSHRRFQKRVEDSVERNAEEVAAEVDRLFRRYAPELVLVAGDEHVVSNLTSALVKPVLDKLVRIESGGRAAGTSHDALSEAVETALARHIADRDAALVDAFAGARGRQREAVQGLADVVDALRRAQVAQLLLQDDPTSDQTLWVGEKPLDLGLSRDDITALGVSEATEVPAAAALVWALLGSGGGITLVAEGQVRLTGGIGALLRWTDGSTPHDGAPSMPGHGQSPR